MNKPYHTHPTSIVGPNAVIGENTRIRAFCNIQDGARIGRDGHICDGCFVEKGVVIGDRVTVKNGVSLFEGVTLEDDVFIAANAAFINDRRPRRHSKDDWTLERIRVGRGASVGSNATVMCGVTVGEYAFVGAGSVVTRDVPPHALVFGNPARAHGWVCRCGERLGEALHCGCGRTYRLSVAGLVPTGGESGEA